MVIKNDTYIDMEIINYLRSIKASNHCQMIYINLLLNFGFGNEFKISNKGFASLVGMSESCIREHIKFLIRNRLITKKTRNSGGKLLASEYMIVPMEYVENA